MQNLPERVHFIGIGGVGMSGLASILLSLGHQVSGSDIHQSNVIQRLQQQGAICYLDHREENIKKAQLVVVSSAIRESNPELQAARKASIPVVHRSEILAFLMEKQAGIAVAGAHGKTTTSSMLSLVLEKNGMDPTIVVGGELNDIGGNAKYGGGSYLVAEADESDGSFLKLSPKAVIITNVEDDHLDHYGSVEKIREAFQQFIAKVPEQGVAVLCLDDPGVREVSKDCQCPKIYYSVKRQDGDYTVRNISFAAGNTQADVYENNQFLGTLSLQVPGEHNVSNALGVIAAARWAGLNFPEIAAALETFSGAGRRFELLGEVRGSRVVDDYGHHPTEIAATLKAARQICKGRVICVFQPHRYTRTALLHERFGEAFGDAQEIIVTEIYSAGETPMEGISAKLIVEAIEKHEQRPVTYLPTLEEVVDYLQDFIRPEDLVLTMGAGNVWSAGVLLVEKLRAEGE